ncbi:hypothetical protein I8H89_00345 [Candidatus Saccharibacteria bacterium]|nr:hypothetical protein [Candidatus Saccharibacteria bacterium]
MTNPIEVDQVAENLYTNDGGFFALDEPEEQKDERSDEEAKVYAELPIMNEALKFLQEKKSYYDSVSGLPEIGSVPTEQYMAAAHGNQLAVAACDEIIKGFTELIKSHITEKQTA